MGNDPNDKKIQKIVKKSMDELTDAIGTKTQIKLNEIRHNTIYQNNKKSHSFGGWQMALGTLALVIMMGFFLLPFSSQENLHEVVLFADLELLSQDADTEFYQDLDFISWLDENEIMAEDI